MLMWLDSHGMPGASCIIGERKVKIWMIPLVDSGVRCGSYWLRVLRQQGACACLPLALLGHALVTRTEVRSKMHRAMKHVTLLN